MVHLTQDDKLNQVRSLLNEIQRNIYRTIVPLELTVWRSREPLPFAERECGQRADIRICEPWAQELFDCAWMRFRAQVPVEWIGSGELVARIDVNGELFIVDAEGVPVRGLTNIKSTFDPTLGGPAKTVYALSAEQICGGSLELWADAGLNDLFGFLKDEGRVALAEVAEVRQSVRQLYYDVETLHDYLNALLVRQIDTAVAERLADELVAVGQSLDLASEAGVESARRRLAHWFSHRGECRGLRVHAVGHAHLDLAWLWPLRETIRKGARTFASALYNIERYPEYIFGASQPQLFAWMKEFYPKLYARIKGAVKAGRIELQGTFWVEPDCNIPNGESYIRQILHGRAFFADEFGIVPDYCWEPDVFGYNGQLPQILSKSGHKYFMTQKLSWNVVNRFPLHSFHWQGIDGSSILTHMLPEETYNSPAAARSLLKISHDYAQKDVSEHALMAFGIGDGGGGPDAEHLERLRRAPALPGMPQVCIAKAADFFPLWQQQADRFPTWRGELYLERHQGTLTTQALVKRNNRRAETALRELEWASSLAEMLAGVAYPVAELDRLWKEVLLYQFHDILPGSSIKRVYSECNSRYGLILEEIAQLTMERYRAVSGALQREGCKAVQEVEKADSVAFNSLSWHRKLWNKNPNGVWQYLSVPAFGWQRIEPSAADVQSGHSQMVHAGRDFLENEHLQVRFAAEGYICSMLDKQTMREYLQPHERSNDFVVIIDTGDAWDFETDYTRKDVECYLRRPVERPVLVECFTTTDGPLAEMTQVWRYKSSQIRQRISLFAGERQITFSTEVDWEEEAAMLRVRFASTVASEWASFEIPFGHIRRSTLGQTSEQRAQVEVGAQQWVDLSEAEFGLTVYNDCKYGFRIKDNVIDMTLLRCVPHPGAPLINKEDRSLVENSNFTDLGHHRFSYALHPHEGVLDAAVATRKAREFNLPLAVVSGGGADSASSADAGSGSWFRLDSNKVELAAIKRSESGRGWVLRLVNICDETVVAKLDTILPLRTFTETDLIEQPLKELGVHDGGNALERAALLHFSPFEIKTLYCE